MVIGRCRMRPLTMVFACAFLLALGLPAAAADSKVKAATKEVESGAKKVGQGVEETAKGIGKTVVEGAKSTGATLKETGEKAGKAVEHTAKSAWEQVRDGTVDFGRSVKKFFARLFGSSRSVTGTPGRGRAPG